MSTNKATARAARSGGAGLQTQAVNIAATLPRGPAPAAEPVCDASMLDIEYDQTERALIELDQSVQWLLQRIQPVCQPYAAGNSVAATASREPETPASELRMKLRNLRSIAEGASARIADMRYTIEI